MAALEDNNTALGVLADIPMDEDQDADVDNLLDLFNDAAPEGVASSERGSAEVDAVEQLQQRQQKAMAKNL